MAISERSAVLHIGELCCRAGAAPQFAAAVGARRLTSDPVTAAANIGPPR